jgi:hypothetical protein
VVKAARPGRGRRGRSQLGQPVEVLGGRRGQVGRGGQLGQVAAVAHGRQDGGHHRVGQDEAEQRLVQGLVAVLLQERQALRAAGARRGASGSRAIRPAPASAASRARSAPGCCSATL